MMLCGQQLVLKRVHGARRVGFAGYLARFQSKILLTMDTVERYFYCNMLFVDST